MRTPIVVKTLALLAAFAMAPCLLRSSEPSSKAETEDSVGAATADSASEAKRADKQAAPDADLARPFVYLDKTVREGRKPRNLAHRGILHQELYRQAFLMAAREECGAVTRDARLCDPMPTERDNLPFAMASTNLTLKNLDQDEPVFKLEIRRGLPGELKERVVELQLEKKPRREDAKASLLAAEELSRGRFKEILEQEGFPATRRRCSQQPVPADVEELLGELVFTSQFAAIRRLHALVREHGESPALLGALVRGYANLGVLTELYWAPAHKVFKARALLYAQRMLTTGEDECWARWHRAYAFALTGIPIYVVEDLDAAAQGREQSGNEQNKERPAWVEVLDAYGGLDLARLKADEFPEPVRPFAHLMRYELIKQCGGARGGDPWTAPAAQKAAWALPDCYRVNQAVCRYSAFGPRREATARGIRMLGERIYADVLAIPELPPAAEKICQSVGQKSSPLAKLLGVTPPDTETEYFTRRRLIQSLLGEACEDSPEDGQPAARENEEASGQGSEHSPSTDKGELSWATLGHLVREISFLQVWHRACFLRYSLSVPPEEFIERSQPLVADHPYRLVINTLAWEAKEKIQAQQKADAKCDWDDMEPQAARVLKSLWDGDKTLGRALVPQFATHYDITMNDLRDCCYMPGLQARSFPAIIKLYLAINPPSPTARCLRLQFQWDEYKDQAAAWAEEYSEYPVVQKVVGMQLSAEKRYKEAIPYFKKALELSRSQAVYYALAKAYDALGQEDKWLATLQEHLKMPHQGLGHSKTEGAIARILCLKGHWETALPYAEAAAGSGAFSGLRTAAVCHEGLGHWAEAERYYKANAERYPPLGYVHWYLFCRRTGKGHVEVPRAWIEQLFAEPESREHRIIADSAAAFYVLEGNLETALSLYKKAFHKQNNPYYGLLVALVADQLGQTEECDAALKRIVEKGPGFPNPTTGKADHNEIRLAKMLIQDLAEGGQAALDVEAARKLHPDDSPYDQVNLDYFLGKYFELRGHEDRAVECWRRCMVSNVFVKCRTFACSELLRRGHGLLLPGESPRPDREKEQETEEDPETVPEQQSEVISDD